MIKERIIMEIKQKEINSLRKILKTAKKELESAEDKNVEVSELTFTKIIQAIELLDFIEERYQWLT